MCAQSNQESSSCISIERCILQSVFRFRLESSNCSCSSREPFLCSMAQSNGFPLSCQTRPCKQARGRSLINSELWKPIWPKLEYPGRMWGLKTGRHICFKNWCQGRFGGLWKNLLGFGTEIYRKYSLEFRAPLRNVLELTLLTSRYLSFRSVKVGTSLLWYRCREVQWVF